MFSENPQETVAMWAQQNKRDVLYLDLQKPKEGTEDQLFLEGRQQGRSAKRTDDVDVDINTNMFRARVETRVETFDIAGHAPESGDQI